MWTAKIKGSENTERTARIGEVGTIAPVTTAAIRGNKTSHLKPGRIEKYAQIKRLRLMMRLSTNELKIYLFSKNW